MCTHSNSLTLIMEMRGLHPTQVSKLSKRFADQKGKCAVKWLTLILRDSVYICFDNCAVQFLLALIKKDHQVVLRRKTIEILVP